ncbi:beta family protein [Virgibacillus kimchii]
MSYYPVLKLSNAEMGALSNLKEGTKKLITPIIESKMIPAKKQEDWQATFRTLGTYTAEKAGETRFIYDFHSAFEKIGEVQQLIDAESGNNLVQHCIEKLEEAGQDFIPCLHFDAPSWMIDTLLHSKQREIAIRIRCHDFNSPIEEIIAERITDKIIKQATNKNFIVLLDFYNSSINENRIMTSLKNFSTIKADKFVLLLTSCPENADAAPANAFSLSNSRDDIKTYFKFKKAYPELEFGDYTVRLKAPLENVQINYYNTYLKIFYSSEDEYYIGKSTLLQDKGIETFQDVCEEIVNSDVYKNPEFSFGDKAIHDCAEGSLEINNHVKPIEFGINHHIELTARQL